MQSKQLAHFVGFTVITSLLTASPTIANPIQYPNTNNPTVLRQAFEIRWMPSGSMEPTLHGGVNTWSADSLLIDKLVYRSQSPKRGDMILFKPNDNLRNEKYYDPFLKRIIALPGEKVQLKNARVYINNKPLPESKYIASKKRISIDVCTSSSTIPYLSKPQIIPPNSYLVLGDNREQSYDGRCWGVVPKKNIIGQVVKRLWPLDKKRNFDETRNSQQYRAEELFLKNIGFVVTPDEVNGAIKEFQSKLLIAQNQKDIIHQTFYLRNLIAYYIKLEQFKNAKEYSQQLLTVAQENKITGAETQALIFLSMGALNDSNYDASINYSQQALPIVKKNQDDASHYLFLFALAMANVGKNDCAKANDYYNQSLALLPKIDTRTREMAQQQLLPLFPQSQVKACLPLA